MAGLLKLTLDDGARQSTPAPDPGRNRDQLALFQDPRQGPLPEEAVPHLIIQLQDDLARSRRREAIWLSIITHLIIILSILFGPKLPFFQSRVRIVSPQFEPHDLTFLELPKDLQKAAKKPNTNIISDKDRIATSRTPTLDQQALHKILDARKQGAPGRPQPSAPVQQASQPPAAQPFGAGQQPTAIARNGEPPVNAPVLPSPEPSAAATRAAANNPFNLGRNSVSDAAAATAPGRGTYGQGGEFGAGYRGAASVRSNTEILSDTMGVNFGPYLMRVKDTVQRNWYTIMPESAKRPFFTQGRVSIIFRILKDGSVEALAIESSSGRVDLDTAARGGITMSNPFQPLPREFGGPELRIRFTFYYNPEKGEIPGGQ
ncbi:MAG: TonB family protein [Acidobacteria bacterium]|nr:TonB family protein [Acidobacteriota bacterium]